MASFEWGDDLWRAVVCGWRVPPSAGRGLLGRLSERLVGFGDGLQLQEVAHGGVDDHDQQDQADDADGNPQPVGRLALTFRALWGGLLRCFGIVIKVGHTATVDGVGLVVLFVAHLAPLVWPGG